MATLNKTLLIAPCGINCGVCNAYLRVRNKCQGCRIDDINKPFIVLDAKLKTERSLKMGK